jgi:guanine deaminase
MNRECVDDYQETSTEASISGTKALISHIRSLRSPLVKPILTPRFAISCTDDLLNDLGKMASADPTLHIQTHVAENRSEVAYTRELFPRSASYTAVYDDAGLLRHNTVLAHGIYLDDGEIELIRSRRAGISHCPTSNFNLSSGIAPVGKYLDRGVKVGILPPSLPPHRLFPY